MARHLITGASGLIGRRVVEAYAASEDELVAVGRHDLDLLAEGAWRRLLDELVPDVIIHLAWSASALPDYRNHDDNWRWSESTIELAQLAADRGIRLLATGTSVDDVPAHDAYSRSKATTRRALTGAIASGRLAWLRPFYIFDEQRPSPAVLRAALSARSAGEPVRLASPHARHDFLHAKDAGTAVRAAVDAGLVGTVDIGSGSLTAVADLVEAFHCEWEPDGIPSSAAASDSVADVVALRRAGWAPTATDSLLSPV